MRHIYITNVGSTPSPVLVVCKDGNEILGLVGFLVSVGLVRETLRCVLKFGGGSCNFEKRILVWEVCQPLNASLKR